MVRVVEDLVSTFHKIPVPPNDREEGRRIREVSRALESVKAARQGGELPAEGVLGVRVTADIRAKSREGFVMGGVNIGERNTAKLTQFPGLRVAGGTEEGRDIPRFKDFEGVIYIMQSTLMDQSDSASNTVTPQVTKSNPVG